jgi:hypothetical protein
MTREELIEELNKAIAHGDYGGFYAWGNGIRWSYTKKDGATTVDVIRVVFQAFNSISSDNVVMNPIRHDGDEISVYMGLKNDIW